MADSVLSRGSALLDHLASDPDRAWSISQLATATNLPAATCHRLMRELVALAWAEQRQQRGGYRLGPRAYALTTGQAYRANLFDAIMPTLQRLADGLGLPVVLAGRRDARRQTIWVSQPVGSSANQLAPYDTDDLLVTSGGRVLLALAPAAERRRLLDQLHWDGVWPGVLTRRELEDELRAIRRHRWCVIERGNPGRRTASAAFLAPDRPDSWLAIGAHAAVSEWPDDGVAQVRAAARQLSATGVVGS